MSEKQNTTIAGRLRRVREHFAYSRRDMASALGIGENAYGKMELGERVINLRMLRALTGKFNISMEWFINNRGSMIYGKQILSEEASVHEIREMLDLMEKVPLFHYSVMSYFQKFKIENHEIIRRELEKKSPETKQKA